MSTEHPQPYEETTDLKENLNSFFHESDTELEAIDSLCDLLSDEGNLSRLSQLTTLLDANNLYAHHLREDIGINPEDGCLYLQQNFSHEEIEMQTVPLNSIRIVASVDEEIITSQNPSKASQHRHIRERLVDQQTEDYTNYTGIDNSKNTINRRLI